MKPLQVIFSILGLLIGSFLVRTVSNALFNDSEKPSSEKPTAVEVAKKLQEQDNNFLEKFIEQVTKDTQFPIKIDQKVQIDNIYAKNNVAYFDMTSMTTEKDVAPQVQEQLRQQMITLSCQETNSRLLLQLANYVEYIFKNQDREKIASVKVQLTDCPQQ